LTVTFDVPAVAAVIVMVPAVALDMDADIEPSGTTVSLLEDFVKVHCACVVASSAKTNDAVVAVFRTMEAAIVGAVTTVGAVFTRAVPV